MTNWKEHAHLFANGKFKVRWNHQKANYEEDVNLGAEPWFINTPDIIDNCTLIARPISDMSDEEIIGSVLFDCLKDKVEPEHVKKELIKMNTYKRTMRICLYLLSIGVYPFDQKAFDDGTVIDINEL